MARWASRIEVAGVSFTGCRGEIQNGVGFSSPFRGSVEWAASGKPHVQHINTNYKGIQFGLNMVSAQTSKIRDVFNAVIVAQAAGSTFVVWLTDELYNIKVNVFTDYSTEWITHGNPAEGFTPDVVMRFISDSMVVEDSDPLILV